MSEVTCPHHRASKSTNQEGMDLGRSESKPHRTWRLGPPTIICHTDVTNNRKERLDRQNAAINYVFFLFLLL